MTLTFRLRRGRGRGREAEPAAEALQGAVGSGGLAELVRPDGADGGGGGGGQRHGDAGARDPQRRPHRRVLRRAPAARANQPSPAACSSMPAASTGRRPALSEIRPAAGAISSGVAVDGRMRSPVDSGEYPSTSWQYCAMRNTAALSEAIISSAVAFAAP